MSDNRINLEDLDTYKNVFRNLDYKHHVENVKLYYPLILRWLRRPYNRDIRFSIHTSITIDVHNVDALIYRLSRYAPGIYDALGGNFYFDKLPDMFVPDWYKDDLLRMFRLNIIIICCLKMIFIKFYFQKLYGMESCFYICKKGATF